MTIKKIRKKIVAGNWKMNKTVGEAVSLAEDLKIDLSLCHEVDVVLCPPFTSLKPVSDVIQSTQIKLGAQNMHWEASGAYTGEISPGMLRELFCRYVILGHSERRAYFSETDADVNKKVKAALATHITPIVCVGETLAEREGGRAQSVVRGQLEGSLAGMGQDLASVVVAYEPVWAIGTGKNATPAQAQEMHAYIRSILTTLSNAETAQTVRIQYGGSMKPANAGELFKQEDIDGGLVGGAALDARSFIEIVRAAMVS
jgi:triosephosphate isomerase